MCLQSYEIFQGIFIGNREWLPPFGLLIWMGFHVLHRWYCMSTLFYCNYLVVLLALYYWYPDRGLL